jgi:hypothetical protein
LPWIRDRSSLQLAGQTSAILYSQCYISSVMSIRTRYRKMPAYLAVSLALVLSAVMALALAALGVVVVGDLLDGFHGRDDLNNAFLAFFYAGPAIALLGFVSGFSALMNWHRATSWWAPTIAFVVGAILVWMWAHDFGGLGVAWYIPGAIAWLLSCWFLRKNASAHPEHAIEA